MRLDEKQRAALAEAVALSCVYSGAALATLQAVAHAQGKHLEQLDLTPLTVGPLRYVLVALEYFGVLEAMDGANVIAAAVKQNLARHARVPGAAVIASLAGAWLRSLRQNDLTATVEGFEEFTVSAGIDIGPENRTALRDYFEAIQASGVAAAPMGFDSTPFFSKEVH